MGPDHFIRQHLLEEVASVERHLAAVDAHIADQRRRIGGQERTGRDSARSRELLVTFRLVRASHLSHQDRLIVELGQHRARRR